MASGNDKGEHDDSAVSVASTNDKSGENGEKKPKKAGKFAIFGTATTVMLAALTGGNQMLSNFLHNKSQKKQHQMDQQLAEHKAKRDYDLKITEMVIAQMKDKDEPSLRALLPLISNIEDPALKRSLFLAMQNSDFPHINNSAKTALIDWQTVDIAQKSQKITRYAEVYWCSGSRNDDDDHDNLNNALKLEARLNRLKNNENLPFALSGVQFDELTLEGQKNRGIKRQRPVTQIVLDQYDENEQKFGQQLKTALNDNIDSPFHLSLSSTLEKKGNIVAIYICEGKAKIQG